MNCGSIRLFTEVIPLPLKDKSWIMRNLVMSFGTVPIGDQIADGIDCGANGPSKNPEFSPRKRSFIICSFINYCFKSWSIKQNNKTLHSLKNILGFA